MPTHDSKCVLSRSIGCEEINNMQDQPTLFVGDNRVSEPSLYGPAAVIFYHTSMTKQMLLRSDRLLIEPCEDQTTLSLPLRRDAQMSHNQASHNQAFHLIMLEFIKILVCSCSLRVVTESLLRCLQQPHPKTWRSLPEQGRPAAGHLQHNLHPLSAESAGAPGESSQAWPAVPCIPHLHLLRRLAQCLRSVSPLAATQLLSKLTMSAVCHILGPQKAGGGDLVAPEQPLPNAAQSSSAAPDAHIDSSAPSPADTDDVPVSHTRDVATRSVPRARLILTYCACTSVSYRRRALLPPL